MLMDIDLDNAEFLVELSYGIIYALLTFLTYRKYRETNNKLTVFFCAAFLALAISGLYGGISGFIGFKIMEIYETLALLAVLLFLSGLLSIRSKKN